MEKYNIDIEIYFNRGNIKISTYHIEKNNNIMLKLMLKHVSTYVENAVSIR